MLRYLLIIVALAYYMPLTAGAGDEKKSKVNWLTIEEALALNEKEPKKIIIDFYTDWCGWCKKMDKTTFNHPQIAKYLNKNFYAVKFDAEGKESVEYKDLEYKAGKAKGAGPRGGTHEFAYYMVNTNGSMGYPSIAFLDAENDKITHVPSYLDAPTMDAVLKFFGDDHYKKISWGVFEKTFKSRIK